MHAYEIVADQPASGKIDAWLTLLRQLFVKLEYASTDTGTNRELNARILTRDLTGLQLHTVTSTRQHLARSPKRLEVSERDYFLFAKQITRGGLNRFMKTRGCLLTAPPPRNRAARSARG
ncbi:hypothetical protein DBA34_12690 [Pandoraea cepalis]|uniref:Uncharacterized protein n=1 Tax=Pandoraea cepalis TaxID=2508294 RepID=A0AAW7MMU8_9BURK|nr:hypothetical protein [Pandoraea cepalis]